MENQSEIVARFEVSINLCGKDNVLNPSLIPAWQLWKDKFENLSDDEVQTYMEDTSSGVSFIFFANKDRWQDAEAMARDYWRMCRDNSWEVDMSDIELSYSK